MHLGVYSIKVYYNNCLTIMIGLGDPNTKLIFL